MLMLSIVNRGVAVGSGEGPRYGSSVVDIGLAYAKLLMKQATNIKNIGILELGASVLFLWSIVGIIREIKCTMSEKDQ